MEQKEKTLIIAVGVVAVVVIIGLLIGLIVLGVKQASPFPSVVWSNPTNALTSSSWIFAGGSANTKINDTFGPVFISYTPNFNNLWTLDQGALVSTSSKVPNINTQLWRIRSIGPQPGWTPFMIELFVDPTQQIVLSSDNSQVLVQQMTGSLPGSCLGVYSQIDSTGTSFSYSNGPFDGVLGFGFEVLSSSSTPAPIYIGTLPYSTYLPSLICSPPPS